jgi:DNA-binding CsgD family transcriptional regulator
MNIPGITDSNIEIFASDYPRSKALFKGRVVGFWELPKRAIDLITKQALTDREAMKTFREEGIRSEKLMVEIWVWCNLGRFDSIPDFETRNGRVNLEYHECGRRGKCPWEFRRCKRLRTQTDTLTPRETDYLKQTAKGFTDNQIAERMNLKPKSMISLARRVREKVGVSNRAGLASWAIRTML